ncbi:MAG: DUF86 domain-containing protein [Muribaculaceae bacterium]|nr:DUF86 domain-containing protein [Muribaculaceae bacterium]
MESLYSDSAKRRALQTLFSIDETIRQLIDWNKDIHSTDDFASSQTGMQLLAANAMLISAIGEGVNNVNNKLPNFLNSNFPEIPWREIVGMRNRIVHGYFDLNAEIVLDAIRSGIPQLQEVIKKAILLIK